jgi:hypothetical protein
MIDCEVIRTDWPAFKSNAKPTFRGTCRSQSFVFECLDHIIVFGERHLRHVLSRYTDYYNAARHIYP